MIRQLRPSVIASRYDVDIPTNLLRRDDWSPATYWRPSPTCDHAHSSWVCTCSLHLHSPTICGILGCWFKTWPWVDLDLTLKSLNELIILCIRCTLYIVRFEFIKLFIKTKSVAYSYLRHFQAQFDLDRVSTEDCETVIMSNIHLPYRFSFSYSATCTKSTLFRLLLAQKMPLSKYSLNQRSKEIHGFE